MLHPALARQAQRFAISGLLATGIHVLVAASFMRFAMPVPSIANGVAFGVASIFSYMANTMWSFSSPLHGSNLLRFVAVSSLGCLLAMSVSGTAEYLGLDYRFGIGLVVCVVPPITFVMHRCWTYRQLSGIYWLKN